MEYLKVSWIHDHEDDPVLFYCELDHERYEVRKIEIYRNGSFGLASLDYEYNGSMLGIGSVHQSGQKVNKQINYTFLFCYFLLPNIPNPYLLLSCVTSLLSKPHSRNQAATSSFE